MLSAGLGAAAVTAPSAVADTAQPTASSGPLSQSQAQAEAVATGKPVQADAATTDDSTLTANPDGTFTLTQNVEPVRKWTGSGWATLDPSLRRNADGSITTTATTSGLTLSPGGSGPLATMVDRGRTLALTFPVALPAPSLSGPTATYPNVLPGVDLVASATAQGAFSEVLVVKDATAAANPQLKTLTMAVATKGVHLSADAAGNITASNATGAVFNAPAPVMWDSATTATSPLAAIASASADPATAPTDPATGEPIASSTDGPGEGAQVASLKAQATNTSITLSPNASLLTGSATTYPVYIDPFVTPSAPSSLQAWTYTNSYYSTASFWKAGGDLRVGFTDDPAYPPTYTARSYLQISVPSALHGAKILTSQLNITEDWSWSCTPEAVQLWTTSSGISSTTDWANQPSPSGEVDSQTAAHGWSTSSCPNAGVGFDLNSSSYKNFNGKTVMQNAADSGASSLTLVLKAASESNDLYWKKFESNSVSVSTTYDTPPSTPASLSTSPTTSCSHSVAVGDGDVYLYAKMSDKDGGTVGATFTARKTNSTGTVIGTPTNPSTYTTTSGQILAYKLSKLTLEGAAANSALTVYWDVTAYDGHYTSAAAHCSFVFDPTRPSDTPNVTVPGGSVIGTPTPSVTIGCPSGGCTGTVPASYVWQLNGGPTHTVAADSSGNATITITPNRRINVLTVNSLSAGGNYGLDPADPSFDASPPATPPADGDLTGDGTPDQLTVGNQSGMPAGLWLSRAASSNLAALTATDIGIGGIGDGAATPAAFNATQVFTGTYTGAAGSGLQDVFDYKPSTGVGAIIEGNGDGTLDPTQESTVTRDQLLDPNGDSPTQLANAGHTYTTTGTLPDLIGTSGDPASGYSLELYGVLEDTLAQFMSYPLTNASPDATADWDQWTIATAQTSSGTAMFLWKKSSGALYLWTGLTHQVDTSGNDYLTYTSHTLAASGWNTGAALTLQAGDINRDGNPDLWTTSTGGAGTVIAYLYDGNTTVTAQPSKTLIPEAHTWPLNDNAAGTATTAADTTGTNPLTGGGAGATWDNNGLFTPNLYLNGTSTGVMTANEAVDVSSSFSVSVWTQPTSASGVILAQTGTYGSGFILYPGPTSWQFCMETQDSSGFGYDCASGGQVELGTWTQLTATYNSATKAMALYINGRRTATGSHKPVAGWTGSLAVGEQLLNGAFASFFKGNLAEARIWNQALTAGQVASADETFASDGLGVWRPANNTFYLGDSNTSNTTEITQLFGSNANGDLPVTGDWDASGETGWGVFDPTTNSFYLHNGDSPTGGTNDISIAFGATGDKPVTGDWYGTGKTTVGIWRPSAHTFYFPNSNTDGTTNHSQAFGISGDLPVTGDWNGSGITGYGVFRPSNHTFYLHNGDDSNPGTTDETLVFGTGTGLPVAGDWYGTGTTTVGQWQPSNNTYSFPNSNTDSTPNHTQAFGTTSDDPVIGHWHG
ncbi:LamG-like jellyroll fold domain-containing protein [Streptacidiphilus cavernicola]|uniref:LamG-like jellyroll fold domain-containing protein n=1 Tax=Streptacidiphilus cavernicola TaxID=3342716 RepID=A0ABV6W5L1_9ACTN